MMITEKKLDIIVKAVLILVASMVFGAILYFQPFYGLMDDANLLYSFMPKVLKNGFFYSAWEYATDDINWGMFRLIYPMMIYFLYSIAMKFGIVTFFLINAFSVFFIYGLNALILGRILKIKAIYILVFSATFFYAYDLFQHPSLQEKLIMLFGAPLLYFAASKELGYWKKFFGITLFTVLGVLSKASFCIYIGVAFVALLSSMQGQWNKKNLFLLFYLFLLDLLCVGFLAWVSTKGNYTTEHYSVTKVGENLKSFAGVLFLVPLILGFVFFFRIDNLKSKIEIFIPLVGVLAFLVIFLPWGIAAYIQTVIVPLYSALAVQILGKIFPEKRKALWLLPLCALALSVAGYRAYGSFHRLADLREIITRAAELKNVGVNELEMSCSEGAGSMTQFFGNIAGVKIIAHPRSSWTDTAALDTKIALFDKALCPLPGKLSMLPNCTGEVFYSSSFKRGFQIVKFHCPPTKQ